MRFTRPLVVAFASAGTLVGWASAAGAFVEDLCFGDAGTAVNCYPLPVACAPAGSITPACKAAAFTEFTQNGAGDPALGVRSVIHTDSVNLMAQAVGFSVTDAYWIAAYSGSVDYGRPFLPYDTSGHPVTSWNGKPTATVPLVGFDRLTNSVSVPSFFMHFITPYHGGADTPVPGINGLVPDVTNATNEPELSSFQLWALADFEAGAGEAPMCSAGITALHAGNFGTGTTCFAGNGSVPAKVGGSAAAAGTALPLRGQRSADRTDTGR